MFRLFNNKEIVTMSARDNLLIAILLLSSALKSAEAQGYRYSKTPDTFTSNAITTMNKVNNKGSSPLVIGVLTGSVICLCLCAIASIYAVCRTYRRDRARLRAVQNILGDLEANNIARENSESAEIPELLPDTNKSAEWEDLVEQLAKLDRKYPDNERIIELTNSLNATIEEHQDPVSLAMPDNIVSLATCDDNCRGFDHNNLVLWRQRQIVEHQSLNKGCPHCKKPFRNSHIKIDEDLQLLVDSELSRFKKLVAELTNSLPPIDSSESSSSSNSTSVSLSRTSTLSRNSSLYSSTNSNSSDDDLSNEFRSAMSNSA